MQKSEKKVKTFAHTHTHVSRPRRGQLSTSSPHRMIDDDTAHTAAARLYCTLVGDFPPAFIERTTITNTRAHETPPAAPPAARYFRARGPHSVELVLLHALAAHLEVGRREGGLLRRAQPVLLS